MGHFYNLPPTIISRTGAQPDAQNKLSPGIPGQSVNNPPPVSEGRYPNATPDVIVRAWQADPWPYVFVGLGFTGLQPYGHGQLTPSLLAVEVDNPPFAWQQIPTWDVRRPPILAKNLNPQLLAVPVNNPPFQLYGSIDWLGSVLQQWIPPDPPPVQHGPLSPSIPGQSVDNPPFSQRTPYPGIFYQWQPPDPPPVQRGPLSPQLTAVRVDNPPLLVRQPWVSPPDTPWLQSAVKLVQPFVAASLQQAFTSAWLNPILISWQPPDPLPTLPKNLNPQLTAVEVDNPPFAWQQIPTWGVRGGLPQTIKFLVQPAAAPVVQGVFVQTWLSGVLTSWQPPDPPPTLPKQLSPGIPGQSVDNPPRLRLQPSYQLLDTPYPQIQVKQVQPFIAASVQSVFTSVWLNPVLASWQPADPLPTLAFKLNPSLTAVTVNNPPFTLYGNDAWIYGILQAWQPPDPPPVQKGPLNPSITAVEVDNPPFAWQQIPTWSVRGILPQTTKYLAQPGPVIPSSDNPPFGLLVTVIEPWITDYPAQQPSNKLVQPGTAPAVQVSFTRAWLATVIQAWQPPDPLPTQLAYKVVTGVQVNNPPFTHMGRSGLTAEIIQSWQPPDPPPAQRGPLNPQLTAVEVDNPPVTGFSDQFWNILATWEIPLPPPPQQTKYIVTIIPPPPPSTEIHDHPWFATFGKMTVH